MVDERLPCLGRGSRHFSCSDEVSLRHRAYSPRGGAREQQRHRVHAGVHDLGFVGGASKALRNSRHQSRICALARRRLADQALHLRRQRGGFTQLAV